MCLEQQQMFFYISAIGLCVSTFLTVLFVASPGVRTGSFFLFVAFANGLPFVYQGILIWTPDHPVSTVSVPMEYMYYWMGMLCCVFLGLLVKSSTIPERFFPGKFDVFFQSHQLWHIFINVGNSLSYFAWVHYLEWRNQTPCPSVQTLSNDLSNDSRLFGSLGSCGWFRGDVTSEVGVVSEDNLRFFCACRLRSFRFASSAFRLIR